MRNEKLDFFDNFGLEMKFLGWNSFIKLEIELAEWFVVIGFG